MLLTETDTEFYPTPKDLAHRMVSKLSFSRGYAVLEPSAGKGDLIDALLHTLNYSVGFMDIDAVEVVSNSGYCGHSLCSHAYWLSGK